MKAWENRGAASEVRRFRKAGRVTARERLSGIPASPGVVAGTVFLIDRRRVRAPKYRLNDGDEESEVARLREAVEKAVAQLDEIRSKVAEGVGSEHGAILDAHRMMVSDETFLDHVRSFIREEKLNAEWALRRAVRAIKERLAEAGEYLAERRADVDEVAERLIANLVGEQPSGLTDELPAEGAIIVAHDLSTADAAMLLVAGRIAGLVTDVGGRTSHTAIVARALEVPAVVGTGRASLIAVSGDPIVVDGTLGEVLIGATRDEMETARRTHDRLVAAERALLSQSAAPAETTDGHTVSLVANIEFSGQALGAVQHGAVGVGLYRTEFLYLNRNEPPTEEEHFADYRAIVEAMGGRPVTIRTFDLGADKIPRAGPPRSKEPNPALGLRAIRYSLMNPSLFMLQLRALWRAAAYGPVRVMIPLVSGVSELRAAKAALAEARAELVREGVPVAAPADLPVGIMVETPAAAVIADRLAHEAAFFSIGTNDLIQYSLAIDRHNRDVAYLYRPMHLSVLRLIKGIVEAAHTAGIEVAMCGEMAGDPFYTLVLLGLGLDAFSMDAASIPQVKQVVRRSSMKEARELADAVMGFTASEEIERFVHEVMQERFGDLLA